MHFNVFRTATSFLVIILFFKTDLAYSQEFEQTIKGWVTDAESKKPLAGVTVRTLPGSESSITDRAGFYSLNNTAVGRYQIQITAVGYESRTLTDIVLSSGKELELNIALVQDFKTLDSIVIRAAGNRARPVNEFATVSASSFSSADTKRYPAAFSDPARMLMNMPGVSAADDMNNSVVVRGNSPQGVLWKLEGIEIPTPNHFSNLGGSGGAISMLSSNVIGKSDFYTGAFPAEIGNATAAVFDLNFRDGNKDKPEYSVALGTLGTEVSTEGPMDKQKRSSYLVNYRYSTLALLKHVINLQGQSPDYQDLSFKFKWDSRKLGFFSLFGLGGYNKYSRESKKDSSKWDSDEPNLSDNGDNLYGVIGLSHQAFVKPDAYVKTVISASYTGSKDRADTLNPADQYVNVQVSHDAFTDRALRISSFYNEKLDSRNTIRTGFVFQQLSYNLNNVNYDDPEKEWKQVLLGNGNTQFYQAFAQWKYRVTDKLTLHTGLHGSYLALNGKRSIEPRTGISYRYRGQVFSLAAGLHTRPQQISTYLFENVSAEDAHTHPNKNLDLTRAAHFVLGYEKFFSLISVRTKVEAYYQYLYKIPVEQKIPGGFSAINMADIYDLGNTAPLVSRGNGQNYGIDLSVEKPFSNDYYFMSALSLFNSTYTNFAGKTFNSKYNRNYSFNIIGGKEWQAKRNSHRVYGASGKLLASGGVRNSVIDIPASVAAGREELVADQYYTKQGPVYFRFDFSAYIKTNRKRSTHTLSLEIQNATNHQNLYGYYFDSRTGEQKTAWQLGILPNIGYKIEFH